MNPAASARPHR